MRYLQGDQNEVGREKEEERDGMIQGAGRTIVCEDDKGWKEGR